MASLVGLSVIWPWLAAGAAAVLLITGLVLLTVAWATVRTVLRRRTERRRSTSMVEVHDAHPTT